MYTINQNIENIYIIKKSKFITKLYKINSIEEINKILNQLKKDYKDATHICYAYIYENNIKCSDDKEPSGTAGLPILNVLKMNNLNYILCVVIRYFGGIKLGAGGLSRAYSNSVIEAINKIKICELIEGYKIEMEFSYDQLKLVDYMLINKEIINKTFDYNITYEFYLSTNELEFISELEKLAIHLSIKDKIMITKKNN